MEDSVNNIAEEPAVRLPPGSVVLTKIRGFQPWPSMILKDNMAPSYLTRKKPKSIKVSVPNGNGKKGSSVKSSNEIYLVRFFHDDTYQWVSRLEITDMGRDADVIEDFKEKQVGAIKKMPKSLQLAYDVAKKGLTLEKFAEFGSYGGDNDDEVEVVKVENKKKSVASKKSDAATNVSKKRKAAAALTAGTSKKKKEGNATGKIDTAVLSSSGNSNFEKREQEIKELEAKYAEFVDDGAWKSIPLKNDSKKYYEAVKKQMGDGEQIARTLVDYVVNGGEDGDVSVDDVKKQLDKLQEMHMYVSVSNKLGLNFIMAELLRRTNGDDELKKHVDSACVSVYGEPLVTL